MTRALNRVGAQALGPLLKTKGFRKQARTWRRRAGPDGAVHVVNLQGSMFGTRVEGRCALNLGIYFPALAELLGLGRVTDTPTEADCHLRRRAAMLQPDARDTWFEFRADEPKSLQNVAASIRDLYTEFGEPWLQRVSTFVSARDELVRNGQWWSAAAASLSAGDEKGAAGLIQRAIETAPHDIAAHLGRWATQHSLL